MRLLWLILLLATAVVAQSPMGPQFPGPLKLYLQVTDAQVTSINTLNAAYDQFSAQKQQRVFQVQADIEEKTRATPVDSLALGIRYAEIESINRDLADKRTQLRADVAKVLTEAQRPKVRALDDAQRLLGMASEAECQGLIDPLPGGSLSFISGSTGTGTIGGALGVASAVLVRTSYPCLLGGQFPADLTAYLGLTSAQLEAINQLNSEFARSYSDQQQQIGQLQADVINLMAAEVLDPGAIGQDYAAIENLSREQRDQLTALRAALVKVLTDPQNARLKIIADARGLQSLISQALCEDLLAPLPAQWFNRTPYPGNIVPVIRNGDFAPSRYCSF